MLVSLNSQRTKGGKPPSEKQVLEQAGQLELSSLPGQPPATTGSEARPKYLQGALQKAREREPLGRSSYKNKRKALRYKLQLFRFTLRAEIYNNVHEKIIISK